MYFKYIRPSTVIAYVVYAFYTRMNWQWKFRHDPTHFDRCTRSTTHADIFNQRVHGHHASWLLSLSAFHHALAIHITSWSMAHLSAPRWPLMGTINPDNAWSLAPLMAEWTTHAMGPGITEQNPVKSMLLYTNFQTWLLIGRRHSHRPIKKQVLEIFVS